MIFDFQSKERLSEVHNVNNIDWASVYIERLINNNELKTAEHILL